MANFKQCLACPRKWVILLFAVVSGLSAGCAKGVPEVAPPKPPEVVYVHPVIEKVRDYEDYTGRIEAVKTQNVIPQVSGKLIEILFQDGVEVKKGQDLFLIDPRPFQASLDSATATLHQMDGDMKRKKTLYDRAKELRKVGTNSQEDLDNSKADYEVAVALRDLAQASVATAKLNLEYCHIKADVAGTISRRKIDASNQVTAYQTLLTTIVQVDQVYGNFDLDERTLLKLRRLRENGELDSARATRRRLDVGLADEEGFSLTGIVDFAENMLDAGTGTLRIRVVIDNPTLRERVGPVLEPIFQTAQEIAHFPLRAPHWDSRMLSPNMFVRVRFWLGEPIPATLVPEGALVSDQGVRHLFVINEKDEVEYRPVEIGLQQGDMRVIKSGVSPSDRVIVSGLQRVRSGLKVVAMEKKGKKPTAAAPSPQASPSPSSAGR
jgi:RND family efflux transporter MFP subunit